MYNIHLSISLMVTVASIYLRFYIKVGVGTFLPTLTQPKIPSDSYSTAVVPTVHSFPQIVYINNMSTLFFVYL
jgi:hypothetical protein